MAARETRRAEVNNLLRLIRRRTNMSIADLVAAIDGVSKETRLEVKRSYMKHGVKQIGDRLAAIEERTGCT
jgi:hypothetical protein